MFKALAEYDKKHPFIVEWSEVDQIYVGTCPDLFFGGIYGANKRRVLLELRHVMHGIRALGDGGAERVIITPSTARSRAATERAIDEQGNLLDAKIAAGRADYEAGRYTIHDTAEDAIEELHRHAASKMSAQRRRPLWCEPFFAPGFSDEKHRFDAVDFGNGDIVVRDASKGIVVQRCKSREQSVAVAKAFATASRPSRAPFPRIEPDEALAKIAADAQRRMKRKSKSVLDRLARPRRDILVVNDHVFAAQCVDEVHGRFDVLPDTKGTFRVLDVGRDKIVERHLTETRAYATAKELATAWPRIVVEWSGEDRMYVGRCPDLFLGGCHGTDRRKVLRELRQIVREWKVIDREDRERAGAKKRQQ